MEATLTKSEALQLAEKNMHDYFQTHDPMYFTEDGVLHNMNSGESYRGRAEVGGMLHFFYHVLFEAKAEVMNYIITENKAVVEGRIVGKHIGDMGPIKATGKDVNFPICVTYDLKDGLITEARIYAANEVLMQQLGLSHT